jgi:hypothetical protein
MTSPYYKNKEFSFEKGFLDESVDITYILHLEGNGRLESIEKQLEQFHPTKKVVIVFNKGIKSGKPLPIFSPPYDLVATYLYIFQDANQNKYENILVLEDDFIFGEKILTSLCTDRINHFLQSKSDKKRDKKKEKKESFMYCLGCLPFIQIPIFNDYYHRRTILRRGTHACIYSLEARNKMLNIEQSDIFEWDIYTNLCLTSYMYYEPLCYQLFPQTENKKHWIYCFGITELDNFAQWFLELDKKVEPGYSFFYWGSLFYWIFCFFLLVFYLFYLFT